MKGVLFAGVLLIGPGRPHEHKDPTKRDSGFPPYIGPWNQKGRSLWLCGLLCPKQGPHHLGSISGARDFCKLLYTMYHTPYIIYSVSHTIHDIRAPDFWQLPGGSRLTLPSLWVGPRFRKARQHKP